VVTKKLGHPRENFTIKPCPTGHWPVRSEKSGLVWYWAHSETEAEAYLHDLKAGLIRIEAANY
jgi:hypothetical protein